MARDNPTSPHGGRKGKSSQKDQQHAAYLRVAGERRTTGVCCICGKTVALAAFSNHYRLHAGC